MSCAIKFGPRCRCHRCGERRRRIRDIKAPIWMPNSIPILARNIHVLEAIAAAGEPS